MLSLIPISDANPTRRFPIVTVILIALNIIVFLFVEPDFGTSGDATQYFYEEAPVPCQFADECPTRLFGEEIGSPSLGEFSWKLLFSTFLHGGLLHIAGNMLFLWVFGNNIEDHLGRAKYLLFYLAGGLAAGLAHTVWTLRHDPMSQDAIVTCLQGATEGCSAIGQYVPAVGASGAVAAVMGAYLILFPKHKVTTLVAIVFFWTFIRLSAFVVLGLWFVYQFLIGGPDIAGLDQHGGVAWMAHVGGFVFGALGILLLGGRPQQPHHPSVLEGWRD